jgi:hypothetical protein
LILLSALIVAGAIYWATLQITSHLKTSLEDAERSRTFALLHMFAPAFDLAGRDPRALISWHPLAQTARKMFPSEFAALDRASGGTFPFPRERIDAAHAQWTADWLAWERTHDAEYKLKAAEAEEALSASGGSAILRARLEAVEREKLDTYQRRYQEYVSVAKALQSLIS